MSESEMKIEITAPSPTATATTERESKPLIAENMPEKRGKKGRTKATHGLVLESLNPTLPIAVPEAAAALQELAVKKTQSVPVPSSPSKSSSAPASPSAKSSGGKTSKPFYMRLSRPKSPFSERKYSDPTLGLSTGRSGRPKWLGFRSKRKTQSTEAMNGTENSTSPTPSPVGEEPPVSFELHSSSNSVSPIEPMATPVTTLPGQPERTHGVMAQARPTNAHSHIPTIMVSSHGEMSQEDSSPAKENGFEGDSVYRKFSQSSQKSQCSTLHSNSATSGIGSLLSPSGDECEPGSVSDVESPLSPLSGASSYRGSSEDIRHFQEFNDTDCIERDYSSCTLVSPCSDSEGRGVVNMLATSPPARGFSPPGGEDSGSETSGRNQERRKRKSTSKSWMMVKKVVQVWSPFALQFKKRNYRWVQLAGHQGNFAPGKDHGTIMKKSDDNESHALQALMVDELRPFVPEFRRVVNQADGMFVEMTDLLREFEDPVVMDIKIGVRTYLEVELTKTVLRKDMYEKMIEVDPNEPTSEEHAQKAITKPRYMQWRESMSSSSTLGFRIEGIKTSGGKALKDFKTTKSRPEVLASLRAFIVENKGLKEPFLARLLELQATLTRSRFFATHELIGSSLLFVYDSSNLNTVHMIDFGKTVPLPEGIVIDHRSPWIQGNHEDGYLWGLQNLIDMWHEI